ncbi:MULTISPECIES: anti-sigma factor [Spirosoma]|uniref:Uncharacterized protein n=1 Tax=Spirosoma sordidisoli TaxID=2502893 RepID=A0A4Q2UCL7_9BACT|nr:MULTISPECIES: hypothetical protein [Spirosoma]RYC66873.1 hypothetical protein EQG79_27615 [Spirosoma sordidisoli]
MITDQNKWAIIDAYLAGQLDESGRQAVRQKMTDDADFRADVLMQSALNQQFDREQTSKDYDLVDRLISEGLTTPVSSGPGRSRPVRPWWQQTWLRAVATLLLVAGLGWLGFRYLSGPDTLSTQIPYAQRGFGVDGTPAPDKLTTFPVTFSTDGPASGEYSSDPDGLHLHLTELPASEARWQLRDDPQQGGFLLTDPQGRTYRLDRDTYGGRKPLVPIK